MKYNYTVRAEKDDEHVEICGIYITDANAYFHEMNSDKYIQIESEDVFIDKTRGIGSWWWDYCHWYRKHINKGIGGEISHCDVRISYPEARNAFGLMAKSLLERIFDRPIETEEDGDFGGWKISRLDVSCFY